MAEQQFDINKRLITMLKNEMRAKQMMNSLAKQSSKYHNNVAAFKETIEQQQRESERMLELVIQRREDIETRIAIGDAVQEQVSDAKQRKESMQELLATTKQEHNQLRGCVRTLCDATNTFVSKKELPTRLKGVSVSHSGDEWVPFNVAASDLKGLSTIWNQLQIPTVNSNKWRQLMSAVNPHNDKESDNISAASIIEIDLTSPSSQK